MSLKSLWTRDFVVGILAGVSLVAASAADVVPFTMTEVARL